MKKLVMSLLLTVTVILASPPTNCERNPHECYEPIPGPVGPQGEKGDKGDPGDTVIGPKGDKGDDGESIVGPAGADGESIKGDKGDSGADGKSIVGPKGDKGDAIVGPKGQDADMTRVTKLEKRSDFALDYAAGAMATSSIDFGTTTKGETIGGLGFGVSKSQWGTGQAVGAGLKHGMTEVDAAILKVWVAGSNSYGGGLGVTHRF